MSIDGIGVAVTAPVAPIWHVGRRADPYRFSWITPDIDRLDDAGNRFDVLGGGVLYAATERRGAFVEVLQKFRPTTATRAAAKREQPHFMTAGSVPAAWRDANVKAQLTLTSPAPFVDIEDPCTWPILEDRLAAELAMWGINNIDVSVVRGPRRLVTRLFATWAYLEADPATGDPRYSGIRYLSKFGDHECWALFDATAFDATGTEAIALDDDFRGGCGDLDLLPH